MKTIDLTKKLTHGMEVYPGDPEVVVEVVSKIEDGGWRQQLLSFVAHQGTHVNLPAHCVEGGKTLDDYAVDDFMGDAVLYETDDDIQEGVGVLFKPDATIDERLADLIIERRPKFVGFSVSLASDGELILERKTLAAGIISFEQLEGTERLPKRFKFYGVPLKIDAGDGSPVRAFAVIE